MAPQEGTLALGPNGTLGALNAGAITIASGTVLDVVDRGSNGFLLGTGRTLTNLGTIQGVLSVNGIYLGNGDLQGGLIVNPGGTVARSSGTLAITGTITNQGIIRFTGGATLQADGVTSLVNNGLIDLLTASAASALPTNIGGTGIVLLPGDVKVKSTTFASGSVTLQIDGYTAHSYQLQRSNSLTSDTFVDIGPAQPGTGTTTPATLTFLDNAPVGGQSFYRIVVQ